MTPHGMASPVEYTISRNRDGRWAVPDFGSADDARAWVQAHARTTKQRDAGLSECFGRGRQLVQGARGGWRRFNSATDQDCC